MKNVSEGGNGSPLSITRIQSSPDRGEGKTSVRLLIQIDFPKFYLDKNAFNFIQVKIRFDLCPDEFFFFSNPQ